MIEEDELERLEDLEDRRALGSWRESKVDMLTATAEMSRRRLDDEVGDEDADVDVDAVDD
jgi:hypothetical protein